ncbi:MAG: type II toxin-antitoxin system RelE family toxin [Nocardioidaceae bacterium]
MGAYEVELTGRARRQYKGLDPQVRRRVRDALHKLADDPTPRGAIPLAGHTGLLRVRVGVWRIIYQVNHGQRLILVLDVGHRREVYRRT